MEVSYTDTFITNTSIKKWPDIITIILDNLVQLVIKTLICFLNFDNADILSYVRKCYGMPSITFVLL